VRCNCYALGGWTECYWHVKARAGLFADQMADGRNLSLAERLLVGIEPKQPPPSSRWTSAARLCAAAVELDGRDAARLRGVRYLVAIGDQVLEVSA
jgi:hypothetical protein